MTSNNATGVAAAASLTKKRTRTLGVGFAAALLLSCSPIALHAETSNNELAKEIAELKAQIRELRGSVSATRTETRREVQKVKAVAARTPAPPPPVFAAIPEGATPVFVTADKKMQYGSLTITPGGFIAMESASRTRTEQTDFSAFNNIPFNNSDLAHTSENRFTARQSRPAVLIEAPISSSMLVSGYGEFDFLGAGTNTNLNQASSYVPRIRHLYATLDNLDYGYHVLAGQTWSLVTLNSKGITPRNEVTPPQIDAAYLPGFEYARIPQIRFTKDFGKKLWLSVDLEASQSAGINTGACGTTVGNAGGADGTANINAGAGSQAGSQTIAANAATGVISGTCLTPGNNGFFGQGGSQANYSLNTVPDVAVKGAYEARFLDRDIHFEAAGIYRDEYNNTNYGLAAPAASSFANPGGYASSSNQHATGYGIEGGIIVPVVPKKLDFQASTLVGRGLAGRFASTAGLPDATVQADGRLHPIGYASGLVGLTYHVTPSIDVFAFAGAEQLNRSFSEINGAEVGYGLTGGVNNYGCNVEGGSCTGQTHRTAQLLFGINDKLYKGSFGEVRVAVNYSYTVRELFAATTVANGVPTAAAPLVSAKANESTILTSFRYYPFQ